MSDFEAWAVWTCNPSKFDWRYNQEEHCFIIEGSATIKGTENTAIIKAGDHVIFPKRLNCIWEIHNPIKNSIHFYKALFLYHIIYIKHPF